MPNRLAKFGYIAAGITLVSLVNSRAIAAPVESERVAQTGNQTDFVLAAVRSQLSDLSQFPLLLPSEREELEASSSDISPTALSQPSLFWAQDQVGARYGSDRLVDQWRAYQVDDENGRPVSYVDAVVNERIWNLLTYFERYAVITQLGTAAKDYGYNLRVFHTGDAANADESRSSGNLNLVTLRGAYVCDFDQLSFSVDADGITAPPCEIVYNALSRRRRQSVLSN